MTPEIQARAELLFYEALDLPVAERAAFLDEACGVDVDLRGEVDELLRAYDTAPGFLHVDAPASPELESEFARLKPEEVGERIGNYKLLEQIGEGGFGVVWVAEQEKPMRRRVALKIIKLGMDTKQVIARFEQERQALAMMDHPNIAKVLDAGATPFGRPFFVMELVRGVKITEYCDQANLPTHERLRLFIAVCNAVQHAHQKGIIHRDLKPSNILVTLHDGVPVPKVIDFGVAKATQQQRLTDLTVYTQFEQMIGTPLYMSPEQAEMTGLDIDTRSDIYSLGVLLYELLAGRTPFDPQELMKRGVDEIRRVVREQEPQKPSTFVSTMAADMRTNLAQRRQTDGARLVGQIRGDLDWIVMKALEKDRSRRYETATGLAQDILRHLQSEPVQARPPTTLYRFRRMVRRNKLPFAVTSSVLAALLIGLGIATWMFFQERHARERAVAAEKAQGEERRKAESEASKSRQVAKFLEEMLAGVGPSVALGRETKLLREILDKTAERVGKDLKDQPEVEADLRGALGKVYIALGEYALAETMHREALALRKRAFGNEHPDVAASLSDLAKVLLRQNKLAEAETMLREALAMSRKLLGGEHPQVATALSRLASVLHGQDNLAEAELMFREALAMQKKLLGNEHPEVAITLNDFAIQVLQDQGKLDEAEHMLREALATMRKQLGNEHPDVAVYLGSVASVLQQQGKLVEAEPMHREALAMAKKLHGNEHPYVSAALENLASVLRKQGKLVEAEPMHREALAMMKKLLGNEHPTVAQSLSHLGNTLREQYKLADAGAMHREALAMMKKLHGNEHPKVAGSLGNLGNTLREQYKLADAEAMHREALAMQRKLLGNEHPEVATSLGNLAVVLSGQSKFAEAEAMTREGLALERKLIGNKHLKVAIFLGNLGTVLGRQDKFAEAEAVFHEALAMVRKLLGNEHPHLASMLSHLADVLAEQGKFTDGKTMYLEALAMQRKLLGNEHPQVGDALHSLGHVLEREGNLAEAQSMFRESLAIGRKGFGEADLMVAHMRGCLARVIRSAGKLAEAETVYREELATRRKLLGNEHPDVAISLGDLAGVLKGQDKFADAETMYREALGVKRKLLGNEHPDVATLLDDLGSVLVSQGELIEAESTFREALAIVRGSATSAPPTLEAMLQNLAEFYFRQRRYAESEPFYRELLACRGARLPPEAADVLMPTASLARLLADWAWSERSSASKFPDSRLKIAGRAHEAERLLRGCLAIRLRAVRADPWRIADVRSRLGSALLAVAVTDPALTSEARLAKFTEAETLMLEGHERLQQGKKSDRKYKQDSFTRLVQLYQAWDKPDQAVEWQRRLDHFNEQEATPEPEAKVNSSKP